MSFYRDLVKDIGDENVHLLEDGENSAEFTGWIDTGSLMLNALCSGSLYGGVPNNKILGLAGEEATGKTYFALGMVEAFMKKAEDAGSIYYDTESAVTRDMMQNRGIP
jgi:RecA/RadA recombinase